MFQPSNLINYQDGTQAVKKREGSEAVVEVTLGTGKSNFWIIANRSHVLNAKSGWEWLWSEEFSGNFRVPSTHKSSWSCIRTNEDSIVMLWNDRPKFIHDILLMGRILLPSIKTILFRERNVIFCNQSNLRGSSKTVNYEGKSVRSKFVPMYSYTTLLCAVSCYRKSGLMDIKSIPVVRNSYGTTAYNFYLLFLIHQANALKTKNATLRQTSVWNESLFNNIKFICL